MLNFFLAAVEWRFLEVVRERRCCLQGLWTRFNPESQVCYWLDPETQQPTGLREAGRTRESSLARWLAFPAPSVSSPTRTQYSCNFAQRSGLYFFVRCPGRADLIWYCPFFFGPSTSSFASLRFDDFCRDALPVLSRDQPQFSAPLRKPSWALSLFGYENLRQRTEFIFLRQHGKLPVLLIDWGRSVGARLRGSIVSPIRLVSSPALSDRMGRVNML